MASLTAYPANGTITVNVPTRNQVTQTGPRGNVAPAVEQIVYEVYLTGSSQSSPGTIPGISQIDPGISLKGKIVNRLQPPLAPGEGLSLDLRVQNNDKCACTWGDRDGVLILKIKQPSAWYEEADTLGYPFSGVFNQPKRSVGLPQG
jgi:hypothetical protein